MSRFRRILAGLVAVMCAGWFSASAQQDGSFLLTRAEKSDFRETSRYDDVIHFISAVADTDPDMHVSQFGYSFEGRALPLVVWGSDISADPAVVRQSGKTVLFVMANIHAGEVCGKEAMQMLLRDLAAGKHADWKDSLVLLVAPIYNVDGNERISLRNRMRQNGPVAGMGQRPNAQEYDLNRDHMKLDSPEARSLVRLFNEYDPHVVMDLHTTNGTAHAYHITYAPPLHPNTPENVYGYIFDDLLPEVTETVRKKYGWHYFHYGNLPWGRSSEQGWYTFDYRPRFSNNYAGLRNRLGILSEAFAYATFEERVRATYYFVEEVAEHTVANASRIREITRIADAASIIGQQLALTAEMRKSREPVPILMGESKDERNPYTGDIMLRRQDVVNPVPMHTYIEFDPGKTETVPAIYFVPESLDGVVDRLTAHGVILEKLDSDMRWDIQAFTIDSTSTAERTFQQHNERKIWGNWGNTSQVIPAGTYAVSMDQPLARLAFSLLEPMSDDGLANWNVLDRALRDATIYPVSRSFKPWHMQE